MPPTLTSTNPPTHSLAEHRVAEVGDRRRARLEGGGWGSLEALAAAEPARIATLPGIHLALAERIVGRARQQLRELSDGDLLIQPSPTPEVEEASTPPPDPPVKVRSGRRVRKVMDRLDRAHAHAAGLVKGKTRKRAQQAIVRLRTVLKGLRGRLREGVVPREEWRRARRMLRALEERLDDFLDRRPKRSRLVKLRRRLKQATDAILGSETPPS